MLQPMAADCVHCNPVRLQAATNALKHTKCTVREGAGTEALPGNAQESGLVLPGSCCPDMPCLWMLAALHAYCPLGRLCLRSAGQQSVVE